MSKSKLRALLLIAILPMLACQFLRPAPARCRVNMPGAGWVQHLHGDEISFAVDGMDWKATVDCVAGQLVEGQPVRPARAHEILIPVEDTSYRLITSDPDITMAEYRENGSHIRIDMDGRYYVVVLSATPGNLDHAMVRYFMGGETTEKSVAHIYCYDHTEGQEQTSLPVLSSMWTLSEPVTVSLVCSGKNFILDLSTEITSEMLRLGPAPVPVAPVPTITPVPPGLHSGKWIDS